jgi:hypothetical protein
VSFWPFLQQTVHRKKVCYPLCVTAKKVAAVQSAYIPWKGFFDLAASVDEFILLDDVQYTPRDWRNRNRIKTDLGARWLTIPVKTKGRRMQKIFEAEVADPSWAARHWQTIRLFYRNAPCFRSYSDLFADLYHGCRETSLSHINRRFIEAICDLLSIRTAISRSTDYAVGSGKTRRLVELCRKTGATDYVTGPAARQYLDEDSFHREGIGVIYFDYSGYLEYQQLYPPFVHEVSVLDLIFNEGSGAPRFMKVAGRKL